MVFSLFGFVRILFVLCLFRLFEFVDFNLLDLWVIFCFCEFFFLAGWFSFFCWFLICLGLLFYCLFGSVGF